MRQVVRDAFFGYTAKKEGVTPFMYCDKLNLVTTGVGNLIDAGERDGFDISDSAMAPAFNLPWKIKGPGWSFRNPTTAGDASREEIRESWIRTKLREQEIPGFNKRGGFAYADFQPLTLDMRDIKSLFASTLQSFESKLQLRYTNYETWPADAQMAILSMAWGMGPSFNFPAFKLATDRLDFHSAAKQSFFKGGGGTIDKREGRNADNVIMFENAATVVEGGIDPGLLFFPSQATTSPRFFSSGSSVTNKVALTAIVGSGAGLAGLAGWELFKWYDGRRKK